MTKLNIKIVSINCIVDPIVKLETLTQLIGLFHCIPCITF